MFVTARQAALSAALVAAAAVSAAAQASSPAGSPPMGGAVPTVPGKIAYLNSQQILQAVPGREAAEAQLQGDVQRAQAMLKRKEDSLRTMVDTYNKQEVILSPAAKESKQRELQAREQAYQRLRDSMDTALQSRAQELQGPLMQQVQKVIETVRAEEGYAMIFDAASNAGVLVAADTTLDITQKVITRLKTMPPVTTSTGAPRPGATPTTPAKPAGAPLSAPAGATRPKPPTSR